MPAHQPSKGAGTEKGPAKPENMWLNLGFNILLPILILNKGGKFFGDALRPIVGNVDAALLVIALSFPIAYFIWDFFKRGKYNFFSILGLISVLLTGGIGLLQIPTEWFAVKEAAIPLLLGLAVVVSLKTPYPLIRTILFNEDMMDVSRIDRRLDERGTREAFEALLVKCTWLLAASFIVSAVANYLLARWIVVSPSGTEAFNQEVGKMMLWTWVIMLVPSMLTMGAILMLLAKGIKRHTGLEFEAALAPHHRDKAEPGEHG